MPQPFEPAPEGRGRRVAVTGASGFIGRHLIPALSAAGWRPRVLMRRAPAVDEWGGVMPEVIQGDLADPAALRRLVAGADAVLHLAGRIKAPNEAAFMAANRDGAQALADAAREAAPQAHFVLVSSLAAREPGLSAYARSKRAGEEVVLRTLGAQSSVIRPPAVYGPGDRETLVFFQLARSRWVPLLGSDQARMAVIQVSDLVAALCALQQGMPTGCVQAVADERPGGYRWHEIMQAAALAVGNPAPRFIRVPPAMLRTGALAGDLGRVLGQDRMLNSEKLRELLHPDWSLSPGELVQLPDWQPKTPLVLGFQEAARAYRKAGWIPSGIDARKAQGGAAGPNREK